MKKIVQVLLLVVCMVASCPAALAYWEEAKPQEGQTVADVETLALAAPLYTERDGIPTRDEFVGILNARGAKVSPKKYKVVPYDVIADGILQTTGKDIRTLARIPAARVYKNNIATYADAYVVPTVTMSRRTAFFFDVYSATTQDLIFSYEIIFAPDDPDDAKNYADMVDLFYKDFGDAIATQRKERKDAAKAERKEREKAERQAQREREKAAESAGK